MSIEVMKRIKSLLQDTKMIDSHTISAVVAECDAVILTPQPATGEPIGYLSEPISWDRRQSEAVVKITRKPQGEHGFTNPIYTSVPDNASCKSVQKRLEAPQPATPEPVKAERDQLRCAQADAVMPLIGPLLGAWENADREVISQEPELSRQLKAINNAMEGAQPATGKPVAWMASYVDPIGNDHVYVTSHHDLAVENDMHGTPRPLYTHPAPSVPNLIEKAISSGCFGVLPVKATIPMCKAGWGASGGELTFQQIGHIYEEMYKARPLPDAAKEKP